MRFLLCPMLALILLFAGAGEGSAAPLVRVLISENQKNISISVKGQFVLRAIPSLKVIRTGRKLENVPVWPTSKGLKIGKEEWAVRGVRIEPAEDRDLYFNERRFRGSLDILRDKNNKLYTINTLNVEGYLYGVLHHEVAHWWPMEALRAQAIAARTYALYQAQASKTLEFDLKSSTFSQVYGGSTVERFRAKRAVDQTAGEVLSHQGKIFPTYFHATCGGVTAAAKELWKIDIPPLAGGSTCAYCRLSPHYFWETKMPLTEIEAKMNQNGRPVGRILGIEPISRTPSGRVGSLRISGDRGEAVMAAKDFRIWLGGDKIRSTHFKVALNDDFAEFGGEGWGHGVGLCQWGALGQSLLGRSHEEILKFYYPGSEIKKLQT